MSPKSFQQEHHYQHHDNLQVPVKIETTNNVLPPFASSLKIHKESHVIKKSSPSSSGSIPMGVTSPTGGCTSNPQQQQQQRGPVIIYTHSPKIIHTNPKDFMALVQKLTGMCSTEGTCHKDQHAKDEQQQLVNIGVSNASGNSNSNDDNESTSVITEEHCSSSNTSDVVGDLSFGVGPPIFDPPPPIPQCASVHNFPFSMPTFSDCTGDPFVYDYMNSSYPCNQSTSF
ncbi:VQ motif-containing protein 8 chloroplastic [Bienertia sinuspersici]